jgi:endoglucanase
VVGSTVRARRATIAVLTALAVGWSGPISLASGVTQIRDASEGRHESTATSTTSRSLDAQHTTGGASRSTPSGPSVQSATSPGLPAPTAHQSATSAGTQSASAAPAPVAAPKTAPKISAKSPSTTATSSPVGDGAFHTLGNRIIGPDGQVFIPRGVNKGSLEGSSTGWDLRWWEFVSMRGWGANMVRIPLSAAFWLPTSCAYDPEYAARVDEVVSWAESQEMLVLLDNHTTGRGATCGAPGWSGNYEMADASSKEFVRQLAVRYQGHPYVAFDLYNEPRDISDAVWRDGGNVNGWQAVGMQSLLDTVRSTGARNLVFVSGNNWANDLRMVAQHRLRGDADVVYAAHSYSIECNGRPVPVVEVYTCDGKTYPPHLDAWVGPVSVDVPVMITEFGTMRDSGADLAAVIDWAEARGIGWSAYNWDVGPTWTYRLLADFDTHTPNAAGRPVRDALWAANGWHSDFGK